jgi:hypothetical protein
MSSAERRERWLGTYAPMMLLVMLLAWGSGLIIGFGFILYGLRGQVQPVPNDPVTAIYFAGVSLLTIGFGDIVATGGLARITVVVAAAFGLLTIALAISFLFSLFSTFQRREVLVVQLDARAGAPPSGVSLLETVAHLGIVDDLPRIFNAWEAWGAEVLDSHLAYPMLAYFRSSHDNESWVSALGAVLDASVLLLTTVADGPRGAAKMMFLMGRHLVEDLGRYFRLEQGHDPGVERYEFDEARERLAAAGYQLSGPEESWKAFSELRAEYAYPLNIMAKFWAAPPTQWIGDRSLLTVRRHEVS